MDNGRLRKISWYLMGSVAGIQTATFLAPFATSYADYVYRLSLFYWLSFPSLCGGIYAHLRSKNHQPFKQWQFYVFPAIAVLAPIPAFIATYAAMWQLTRVPLLEAVAVEKDDRVRGTFVLIIIGGIAGLVAGFIIAARTMKDAGDSLSGAVPFFMLVGITFLAGLAAGWVAKAALHYKLRQGSAAWVVVASIVLVLLCGAGYSFLSDLDKGVGRIRSRVAGNDLRNCRMHLDAYFDDHRRYPSALEEAQCEQSKEVVITAVKLTKDEYVLTSYHKKGSLEYMMRSDAMSILCRERGSREEWRAM